MDDDSLSPIGMPEWLDDEHLNPNWVSRVCDLQCVECTVEDISNETRLGSKPRLGATLRLNVTCKDGTTSKSVQLVMKQVPPEVESSVKRSQQLGLAREALFYSELMPFMSSTDGETSHYLPKIYYSFGDMSSGHKAIIMEAVDGLDSGVLFGPGNPNNWKRDLSAMVARAGPHPPSAAAMSEATFLMAARLHAKWWKSPKLLDSNTPWLRGATWLRGQGRETFMASQGFVKSMWQKAKQARESGAPTIEWDPLVLETLEAAVGGISWEEQQKRLNPNRHFTLVHGDFWPGNVMLLLKNRISKFQGNESSKQNDLACKILDWEMVGVGSGPQDLGQYVLSNFDPVERKPCERQLLEMYHTELRRLGVDVTFEHCWYEYTVGGLERWLWFLAYFVGQGGPWLSWAAFFHDQIKAFMVDHSLTAKDVIQVRP